MRRRALLPVLLSALVLAAVIAVPVHAADSDRRNLLERVPKDPLLVSMTSGENLAETFDSALGWIGRFAEGEDASIRESLEELDAEIGCSLRDDLLEGLGSDFVFVLDLPPIDGLMGAMSAPEAAAQAVLGRTGLIASVRDRDRFDGCLRGLLTHWGAAEIVGEDDHYLVRFPFDASAGDPDAGVTANLVYGYRDKWLAFGADPEWVRASLDSRGKGERVADGGDFGRVFSHLDDEPRRMVYVNLPKLRSMVQGSMMIQALLANGDPEVKQMSEMLLSDEFMGVGLGTTSVEVDGGTRSTTFGPSAFSGGTAMVGVVAAIAVPNFFNAMDRGKQKRTLADIRSIGTAVEAYAIDENAYPTTDSRWVPVSEIEPKISPMYIRSLPMNDGWGHGLLYWSDSQQYRIVSPGKDGEVGSDWSETSDGGPTTEFAADIVFADGSFVAWPEGKQQ